MMIESQYMKKKIPNLLTLSHIRRSFFVKSASSLVNLILRLSACFSATMDFRTASLRALCGLFKGSLRALRGLIKGSLRVL